MHAASKKNTPLTIGSLSAAPMRTWCAALLASLGACGGGSDGALAPTSTPQPAAIAVSIDSVGRGNPVDLRVARSANGDGFVVWRADDGTRHNLWASRYRANTGVWGDPVSIEGSSDDIDTDFFLTVDASGSAVVVWRESSGQLSSTRFDTSGGAWAAPALLGRAERSFSASGNAAGVVHVVDAQGGLAFEPVSGMWQPTGGVVKTTTGTGYTYGEVVAADGSGNALALFQYSRTGVVWLGSNYFTHSTGKWDQLPPDTEVETIMGEIPGSLVFSDGGIDNLQVIPSGGTSFLAAWQVRDYPPGVLMDIRIASFTSPSRTWSTAKTVVAGSIEADLAFQRVGGNGRNTLLLWTQNDGERTALKALRLDHAGIACDCAKTIDSVLGGGAARADLAVDPQGDAIAIWEQFEGGHANDGSRSNIAISRFDGTARTWHPAMLAETEPGDASSPRASVIGGQALLGWIQSEGGVNRVKAVLQSLADQ